MTDTFSYIENFFSGDMPDEEKRSFEKRCATDPAFAREVGFYLAARNSLQQELYQQKRKEFDAYYKELSTGAAPSALIRKLTPYFSAVAAACLLLLVGWLLFFNNPSPQQMAEDYIAGHLQNLSVTMNGYSDSLQSGIAAFNRQDYAEAERIFRALSHEDTLAPEAVKNLGIVYLVTGRYEQALEQFDILSAYEGLYANHGPFYKAVTLMKRSAEGDQQEARKILQEIIEKELPGSIEAEIWSKQW